MGQVTFNKPPDGIWKAVTFSTGCTIIPCSKIEHMSYNLIFTTKCNDFNYDSFTGLIEIVVGEWICLQRHNTYQVYQV